MWVAPFGNPRITGYLLLHAAYRSLSRPSSAPDAKAFPLRSFQLDLRRGSCPPPRSFTEIAILVNYAGSTKKFFEIVLLPFILSDVVPQLKFVRFVSKANASLLPYFAFITLFSFQGAGFPALLKPDLKT